MKLSIFAASALALAASASAMIIEPKESLEARHSWPDGVRCTERKLTFTHVPLPPMMDMAEFCKQFTAQCDHKGGKTICKESKKQSGLQMNVKLRCLKKGEYGHRSTGFTNPCLEKMGISRDWEGTEFGVAKLTDVCRKGEHGVLTSSP